jgi:hypothetical protein
MLNATYEGNIDFKTDNKILDKLLDIKHIPSVIEFIIAESSRFRITKREDSAMMGK